MSEYTKYHDDSNINIVADILLPPLGVMGGKSRGWGRKLQISDRGHYEYPKFLSCPEFRKMWNFQPEIFGRKFCSEENFMTSQNSRGVSPILLATTSPLWHKYITVQRRQMRHCSHQTFAAVWSRISWRRRWLCGWSERAGQDPRRQR